MDVNPEEIQKAFDFCVATIENPPEEYRVVKQAVLGLVHLSARRPDLRAKALPWILKVIQDPGVYRSNPRRYAVQSIGSITYYDQTLIEPSIQLLMQLVKKGTETSQFVRKAAFVGLSRIGRKYPYFQRLLVPVFMHAYQHPMTKESVKWGVVIGLGKMAQSNVALRTSFWRDCVTLCRNPLFRMRWAGIKALGHMCCPTGELEPNEQLEEKTFALASDLMNHGGWEPAIESLKNLDGASFDNLSDEHWKDENVYLVQYAATHSLALLLRSNPAKWWSRISVIFGKLLLNPKVAAMIKAMVVITYGKIAYFIQRDSAFYSAIKNLLFELCSNSNILVSEPATYGLVNFALAHQQLFPEVKALVLAKLGGNLDTANTFQLQYYLKTWCKMVAKDYTPSTNPRSKVISDQEELNTTSQHFAQSLFVSGSGEDNAIQDSTAKPNGSIPTKRRASHLETLRSVASDNRKVNKLCAIFSTSVIESMVLMLTDISVLDDREFLDNLKALISGYSETAKAELDSITSEAASSTAASSSASSESKTKAVQEGITDQIVALLNLDLPLREAAVAALTDPKVLDDSIWLSNLKLTVFNNASAQQDDPNPMRSESPTSPAYPTSSSQQNQSPTPLQPSGHDHDHYHSHSHRPTARNMQLRDQLAQLIALAKSTTFSLDSNIAKQIQLPPQAVDPRLSQQHHSHYQAQRHTYPHQQQQQQQQQHPPPMSSLPHQHHQSHQVLPMSTDPRLNAQPQQPQQSQSGPYGAQWQPAPTHPPAYSSHALNQPTYSAPPINHYGSPAPQPQYAQPAPAPYGPPQVHSAPPATQHHYSAPVAALPPTYGSYTPPPPPLHYPPPPGHPRGYSPAPVYPPPPPQYVHQAPMPYGQAPGGPPRMPHTPMGYPPPGPYGPPSGKRFHPGNGPDEGPPTKRSRYN